MSLSHFTDNAGHDAMPATGTYIREKDGQPASLTREADYPVRADCKYCRRPIGLRTIFQPEWLHLPAKDQPAEKTKEPIPAADAS